MGTINLELRSPPQLSLKGKTTVEHCTFTNVVFVHKYELPPTLSLGLRLLQGHASVMEQEPQY
jgi:hypothetical protein